MIIILKAVEKLIIWLGIGFLLLGVGSLYYQDNIEFFRSAMRLIK